MTLALPGLCPRLLSICDTLRSPLTLAGLKVMVGHCLAPEALCVPWQLGIGCHIWPGLAQEPGVHT